MKGNVKTFVGYSQFYIYKKMCTETILLMHVYKHNPKTTVSVRYFDAAPAYFLKFARPLRGPITADTNHLGMLCLEFVTLRIFRNPGKLKT